MHLHVVLIAVKPEALDGLRDGEVEQRVEAGGVDLLAPMQWVLQ